jgi:energy-coupling factor transporter ATP-binding protein EcfA2
MRTLDIFVSSFSDVEKEHVVAEQLIRSAAAEFNLAINVHYSNPRRGSGAQGGSIGRKDFADESTLVLSACFWEYPEREENDFLEIPNTGLYDLVICILGSRLGTTLAPQFVMPDGSRARSATDYEVGWALYQSKQTPGYPGLHVYRSRAIPAAPLEPREQRENLFRPWDAVQEFCGAWEKEDGIGFRECCHDFQGLEEFADLFRKHFREFLAQRLNPAIPSGKTTRKVAYSGSNPFRGLDFFDVQHATVYHGRTRAIGEVFDVLKTQAAAKKPFLLVLGPSGSGKSSLVRAGMLPLITQGATPAGTGPWRCALTRPGTSRDPFATLADALLETSPEESGELGSQLRKDPEAVAARISEVMDQVVGQQLDHLLANGKEKGSRARENENIQVAKPTSLAQVKPITPLVLVVDQLEELFANFSSVIQQKYVALLCALANCQHVFIIAALRSDFYSYYQRFSGLTSLGGVYELQPPTAHGIGNIIRFRTEAAGLSFEQDPETNRSLDETILQAAVANPEPLPLLEHLLSRLYERQLARKDGLLLWADYRALGGFQNALEQHAEFVFSNLKSDEQEALQFVIRELLVPSRGEDAFLNRRSIPYRDLVLHPQLNQRQRSGAKGLIDRLIKEGLLSAKIDPQQELLISIPQEALLRSWPRLWELLPQDRRFLRMRERLDASRKPRITRGQGEGLLDGGIDLAGAQTLLTDFGSHLNETQIDYIRKSLARHKPGRKVSQKIGAAAIAVLAIFGAFVVGERFTAESRRTNKEHDIRPALQNADLDTRQRSQLEAERSALELEKLQIAQQNADLAKSQRLDAEAELRKAQNEKAQPTQQTSNLADNQRSAKKGTDSTNELRSGRALTLDSPQNAEQGISTQGLTAPVQSPNH